MTSRLNHLLKFLFELTFPRATSRMDPIFSGLAASYPDAGSRCDLVIRFGMILPGKKVVNCCSNSFPRIHKNHKYTYISKVSLMRSTKKHSNFNFQNRRCTSTAFIYFTLSFHFLFKNDKIHFVSIICSNKLFTRKIVRQQ